MAQRLIERQEQALSQQQRLSARQMQYVRLLEMPLAELEENIRTEVDDNPALEPSSADDALSDDRADSYEQTDDFDAQQEREERADALDAALEGIGRDDEMPVALSSGDFAQADYEEMVYGDTTSFYDKIQQQVGELELTAEEQTIMDYLVGSLDNDGLLRKSLDDIVDELAFRENLETQLPAVEEVLKKLQTIDPAGVGARSLQECLLLQLDRRPQTAAVALARRVLTKQYEAFARNNWNRIQSALHLSDSQVIDARNEIRRLNPKPGAAMGETEGRSTQQITPDFIVDTSDDGSVTFALNRGRMPELNVSQSFADMVEAYKNNPGGMSRQEKEALLYAKEKVNRARDYIDAIQQRRQTLYVTMRAIINWQRKFFVDGDESDLKPMVLKDIAQKTNLDISTISRVANEKYAQTRWGTFPLKFFFSDGYSTGDGEALSVRQMRLALKDIVDHEDKSNPYSDEALTEIMNQRGLPVARRTIAKYRKLLGIPSARMRKK